MKEGIRDRIFRVFTVIIVLVIFAGGLFSAWPAYVRGRSLKIQDAELARRIDEKKREIAKLIENQQRFRTDRDFVETIARENRRVFPGELVFIFEGDRK